MNEVWSLCEAADVALRDGDLAAARRALDAAMSIAAAGTTPRLDAELALLGAELAAAEGDEVRAERMSELAERGMLALGDDSGLLAVRYARAIRALRGDADARLAGMDMAASLLPAVDAIGPPRTRVWLRLELAAALVDSARIDDAVELAGEALGLARPPTADWAAAGAMLARLLARSGRPAAGARVATAILAEGQSLSPALRAELYDAAAGAISDLGQDDVAAALAEVARTLTRGRE